MAVAGVALLEQAWALLKGALKMPKETGTACRMAVLGALVAQ